MQKLIDGIHSFQTGIFSTQRELFERLAGGQTPDTLFITCSDSRINPNLITQTQPGELFILRNAGNIIPPHATGSGGEEATIEFAIVGLGIKDIIVCGHSHCGAVNALLNPASIGESMPALSRWLRHAAATREIVKGRYRELSPTALLNVAIQENVLVQLENLRTYPAVALGLSQGDLKLHAWVYKIETGQVFAFSPQAAQFQPLTDALPPAMPSAARLAEGLTI